MSNYAQFIATCGYDVMYEEARLHAENLELNGYHPTSGTPALIRGLLMRLDNMRIDLYAATADEGRGGLT